MGIRESAVVAARRRRFLPKWVLRLDHSAARRRNAAAFPPLVDAGLRALSLRADRGVLWFTIAGILALGDHRGRRAAVRGVLSLTISSIIANLIGKVVFGGQRPILDDVPIGRRLAKPPTSPSFPSGHSASAAGFVVGAAIESPRTAIVLAPLGAAVAYSRLHTGSHWLSDVVGGLALGAAVAGLGRLVAPPPDHGPAGTPLTLPALPRGRGMFIVINPAAGSGRLRRVNPGIIRRAFPDATVHELRAGEDVADVLLKGIRSHRSLAIGACGGDGTSATAATVAIGAGLPFAPLPGGTLNHFARAVGNSTMRRALRAVLRGTGIGADVGRATIAGSTPFIVINTASVGIYPELVAEREKLERRIGKWPAAIVAATRVLPEANPVRFRLAGRDREAWSVFVGVNRYYPRTIIPRRRRRVDDGVLDVRIVRADVAASRSRIATNLVLGGRLSGWLRRFRPFRGLLGVDSFTTRDIELEIDTAGNGQGFAHDGEVIAPLTTYRARVEIDPRVLSVYAPHHR